MMHSYSKAWCMLVITLGVDCVNFSASVNEVLSLKHARWCNKFFICCTGKCSTQQLHLLLHSKMMCKILHPCEKNLKSQSRSKSYNPCNYILLHGLHTSNFVAFLGYFLMIQDNTKMCGRFQGLAHNSFHIWKNSMSNDNYTDICFYARNLRHLHKKGCILQYQCKKTMLLF